MKSGSKLFVCLGVCVLTIPEKGKAQSPWMLDRRVNSELQQSGTRQETERAVLFFEAGPLSQDEMTEFANLVDKGIKDIGTFLGVSLPPESKIRYYISSQFEISHSRGHSVYLPLERVTRKSAPYLHETLHVIAPCHDCPM